MATYNAWNYGSGTITGNPQVVRSDLTDSQRVDFSQWFFYLEDIDWDGPELLGYLHLGNSDNATIPSPYTQLGVILYVPVWTPYVMGLSPIRDLSLSGNGINVAVFYPKASKVTGKEYGFDFYARRMTGTLW